MTGNVLVGHCIILMLRCFMLEDVTRTVLEVMTTLQQSNPRLLIRQAPNLVHDIATSARAERWLTNLQQGGFEREEILFVDYLNAVIGQVDVTSPDYLRTGGYGRLLEILHSLLRCKGIAVIEDPVCQIVLESLSQVTEGFNDWDDKADFEPQMFALIRETCAACLEKIELPNDELSTSTQSWDADDKAMFQDFRYDVHDYMQSAFVAIGPDLIGAVVREIVASGSATSWSSFEAGVFCLGAFADTLAHGPAQYDPLLESVFHSQLWRSVVESTSTVPDRARQTAIKFLADNTSYLQRHAEDLVPSLNFLFISLHVHNFAGAASRAIYALCDNQRSSLTVALPQFLATLNSLSDIGGAERHRVYGAVAAIVQAVPDEHLQIEPLSRILALINSAIQNWQSGQLDEEQYASVAVDLLQTLSAIGRGLRAPADTPVDLDALEEQQNQQFWTSGPGSEIQIQILAMYSTVLQRSGSRSDSGLIEAACDFIKAGLTEDHPSPFKFGPTVYLQLVCNLISAESGNIDAVMSCATSFLASISPEEFDRQQLFQLFTPVIDVLQSTLECFRHKLERPDSSFPSSSLDFFGRLLPKWGPSWFSMASGTNAAEVVIEVALFLLEDQDTLPRRAAASFFAALFDISGQNSKLDQHGAANLSVIINSRSPQIVGTLIRLLAGECARSELENLTETLRKLVQKQPMLAKNLLKEAMKDDSGVLSGKASSATSMERRTRFVAQIEALRGSRRTNDVVKEFWIACRGSGFGYIA